MVKKGEKKLKHGNDDYSLLIDLIMGLSPCQAKTLLAELSPRYNRRMKTRLYNENGEEDANGKVRLTEYQHKVIRTTFGESFMKKAYQEMTRYMEYLERNSDSDPSCKSKFKLYMSKTHNAYIAKEDGWVFQKCKHLIFADRPKIAVNPYLIDDLHTAREYIRSIPKELICNSMDVKMLIMKFPELATEVRNE